MSQSNHRLVTRDNDDDVEPVIETIRLIGVTNKVRPAYSDTACPRDMRDYLQNQTSSPALVLLDLNTYNGDGRTALVDMKSDGKQRTQPRVVISGAISPQNAAFGYQQSLRAQPMKSARDATRLQTSKTIVVCWLTTTLLPSGRELKQ